MSTSLAVPPISASRPWSPVPRYRARCQACPWAISEPDQQRALAAVESHDHESVILRDPFGWRWTREDLERERVIGRRWAT